MTQDYWRLLWQQKKMALLGLLLAVFTAYCGIALLAVSGWFISAAALAGLTATSAMAFNFFTPGAMVRGLSIGRTLGRYGERLASHEATFRIISHLRATIFRQLSAQPWQENQLDRHQSGSRLLQDIQHIEAIYLSAVLPATVTLAVTLGYLAALLVIWPPLVLWALPWVALAVLLMPWLYSRQVLETQDQLHQQRAGQWRNTSALLTNMRTLTLHGRLAHSSEQLFQQASDGDRRENHSVNQQQSIMLLAQLSLITLTLIIFWQAFNGWQLGQLQAAQIFMVLLLTLGSVDVFLDASPTLAAWRLGLRALQRLHSQPTATAATALQFDDQQTDLIIRSLDYHYPNQPAALFCRFSHRFTGPGWHWICGPSGSGKSTLIALLAGQLQPQQGSLTLPLPAQPPGVIPAGVGLMPQRIDILRASLRDNLNLHHGHTDEQLWQALALVELKHWAEQLPQGLDTWLGDGEWQASGGEIKRLGLARLILQDQPLMLLDEPAAGLDSALAQRIFQRLSEHWQAKLVIANTHDRQLIQPGQTLLELNSAESTSTTTKTVTTRDE